jgi:hypothetical protein
MIIRHVRVVLTYWATYVLIWLILKIIVELFSLLTWNRFVTVNLGLIVLRKQSHERWDWDSIIVIATSDGCVHRVILFFTYLVCVLGLLLRLNLLLLLKLRLRQVLHSPDVHVTIEFSWGNHRHVWMPRDIAARIILVLLLLMPIISISLHFWFF